MLKQSSYCREFLVLGSPNPKILIFGSLFYALLIC